jgi:U3 small nucleolar RNA-associated protein MPP10
MLAEKPWQMLGETRSMARPVNSLLDSTPEFEVANKIAPVITVEHTGNLEEIIKRRILAEDWDDVIPRELPDVGWHKQRGELPEVSQEKSKLSLGELYEREYLKKAVGYDVDAAEKETEEEKAKNEMKTLFANLCSKLDALSNYHFAPRPIADEAEVRTITTPAIAMEEVLPLHVSDARGVAPEEVYGAKRGRDAVLRADSELDQQDRKRRRAAKKSARRKARKARLADEKLISRLQPGVGLDNPYEKRKMREELSAARAGGKVASGDADLNDYSASTTFFKRMQQGAEQTIEAQNRDILAGKKKAARRNTKSSSLKL